MRKNLFCVLVCHEDVSKVQLSIAEVKQALRSIRKVLMRKKGPDLYQVIEELK